MSDRYWDSELQRWVYDDDIYKARDAADLAVRMSYAGDGEKAWADRWLLKAYEANQDKPK